MKNPVVPGNQICVVSQGRFKNPAMGKYEIIRPQEKNLPPNLNIALVTSFISLSYNTHVQPDFQKHLQKHNICIFYTSSPGIY